MTVPAAEIDHQAHGGNQLFGLAGTLMHWIVRDSRLTITRRDTGETRTVGRGRSQGGQTQGAQIQSFSIVVADPRTLWQMATNPDPGVGEMYMAGQWEMAEGSDIGAFITMMARNLQGILAGPAGFLFSGLLKKSLQKRERDAAANKDHVQAHYDIGNDLYESFLDEGLVYSCAFFTAPGMSLREAQLNKIRLTIARLGIDPGARVLDIGCGWGEAARVIAAETGAASVTGVTLAENQLAVAWARNGGLARPPHYELADYRVHADANPGAYDRIVSIGMFEHVGEDAYRPFFAAVKKQLAPGGRALIHSIMNASMKGSSTLNSPWLEKYIFPGGRLPDLPEMLEAAKAEGLVPAHELYLQPPSDYAETLRRWRANFVRNYGTLDHAKYDTRFYRMWIYYFALCEAMFDGCGFQVGQMVFQAV